MADEEAVQLEEGIEGQRTFSDMMEPPDEVQESQDQETPEAKAAREAAAATAETPEQKVAREEAEADKTKDWTVEDFRKGYKEAETRMHTATGETAKEREAREAAEKRAETAEAKLAEQEAERERLATEVAKPKVLTEEEKDAIFEKAAEEISELDRTDADYLKQYSRIWRKAISAAGDTRPLPDTEALAEEVATKSWEKFQARQAAESAKTAEERQKEEAGRLEAKAKDLAIKAGLDLDDPDSADSIIWDRMKGKIPDEVYAVGTLEAQAEWVAAEVRKRTGKKVEQTDAERKAAVEVQKRNTVMGKGVTFAPSKEIPKKTTLSEMY